MSRPTLWWRCLRDFARLLAGIPPYDAYLAHMRAHHPAALPMTEAAFCRDRQAARFGGRPGAGGLLLSVIRHPGGRRDLRSRRAGPVA